ncbi:MAG TPA: acyl-CoA dehydrogenase family protein [Longimicrobiales bacterium]|nr:acyl-CoA dehydrogenase family protein [Longimicrobiales bacterium]
MDRYLTADHVLLQQRVRRFALEAIVPVARELDESAEFPWESVSAMAEMGLLGVPIPRDLGGMGLDDLSYILVVEELAKHDASHAITVSAHTTLGTSPLMAFGTEEQKRRFVPPLASGEVLGGFGLTEPGAGSDASGTRTRAVRERDGYRLDGSKIFITHAGVGEIFTVTAVTDPEQGPRGISSFLVCKPTVEPHRAREVGFGHRDDLPFTEGVRAGKKEDKMGWRASDTRELLLENAWVPDDQRLGEEGEGFINFMKTLDAGRIGVAALSLGLAQGAFEAAVRYAEQRTQFGSRVWDFQQIQFRLADIATEIEAGRHLTYHAAWLKDSGRPFSKEAAMAKLFCSELAMKATLSAIQVLGGAGYTSEYPVERMMRDAKICEIGEGTNEIQRLVIGRYILEEVLADPFEQVHSPSAERAVVGAHSS